MNENKRLAATLGLMCGSVVAITLTGWTTAQAQPGESGVAFESQEPGSSVSIEIRTEDDFYEPLSPYGRWEMVGSSGRCWIPSQVDAEWSPYADGYWRRTDEGWYWESEEPWGWATYHYGRWDSDPELGWYWVPQTRWAPAWVAWRSGGGYTGWAPLGPSGRAAGEHDRRRAGSGGYVFVEDRQFLEPVRHQAAAVNKTVLDRAVANEAPSAGVIEKASGHKVPTTPTRELRRKEEAVAVAKRPKSQASGVNPAQPSAHPLAAKPAPKAEPRQVANPPIAKAAPPPQVTKKEAVRTAEQPHLAKPVAPKPDRPSEARPLEQKPPRPVAAAPQAKVHPAPEPKLQPAAKVESRPAAPPPVMKPAPAKPKAEKENEKEGPASPEGKEERR